jgi:ketosteroid isomerase-like protein
MKQLFAFVCLAGLLVSCTSTPETDTAAAEAKAAAKAKAEENVAIAEKYNAAFESGDFESWREICAEDFKTYGPGIKSEASLDEYIESMAGFKEATDSVKNHTIAYLPYTVEEGEQAGDYVFWWGSNSAYFVEAGKSAEIMIHTVFKIEDGKIKWETDYWDTGDLKNQLYGDKEEKSDEGSET